MAMPETVSDTVNGNELDELKRDLQRLADSTARPELSDAVLAFITAINYDDEALMKSSLSSLLASLAEVVRDCIAGAITASEGTQAGLKEGWRKYIDKKAYDITAFEELKDTIESIIDERIARMLKLRKVVNYLAEEHEYQVENTQALEDGIRDLRKFREDMLKGWPSRKPPSPIDRTVIAQAREAIARGEKGLRKSELIYPSEKAITK